MPAIDVYDIVPMPPQDFLVGLQMAKPWKPEEVYRIVVAGLMGLDQGDLAKAAALKFSEMVMETKR